MALILLPFTKLFRIYTVVLFEMEVFMTGNMSACTRSFIFYFDYVLLGVAYGLKFELCCGSGFCVHRYDSS